MTSILPSPTAPLGSVKTESSWYSASLLPSDIILCRNTAPLVSVAFRLLRFGVPCRIAGKDIGAGLVKLAKGFDSVSISTFKWDLSKWACREIAKATQKNKRYLIGNIEDKAECLLILANGEQTVPSLLAKIEELFRERPSVLTLSTIHRAKGQEYPRVFILDRHLMPSKYASQPWQLVQERNLHYVAVTRAKLDLVYVNSENLQK